MVNMIHCQAILYLQKHLLLMSQTVRQKLALPVRIHLRPTVAWYTARSLLTIQCALEFD
jgi:hypothetical protein